MIARRQRERDGGRRNVQNILDQLSFTWMTINIKPIYSVRVIEFALYTHPLIPALVLRDCRSFINSWVFFGLLSIGKKNDAIEYSAAFKIRC